MLNFPLVARSSLILFPAVVAIALSACDSSGGDKAPVVAAGSVQGPKGEGGETVGEEDEYNKPGSPTVELVSPMNAVKADSVHGATISVSCLVTDSTSLAATVHDPSTVKFQLIDSEMMEVATLAAEVGLATGDDDVEYVGEFDLTDVPSGEYMVRCIAANTVAEGTSLKKGKADATVFVDHGPLIVAKSPTSEDFFSSRSPVNFEFTIEPVALYDGDSGASIDTISFFVKGVEFPLTEVKDSPGTYKTTVNFLDKMKFLEVPDGDVLVSITATNSRGDEAVTSTLAYSFVLDGRPPVIEVTSPEDGGVVGGSTTLVLKATDVGSAVDWDSIILQLNDDVFTAADKGRFVQDGDTLSFEFDTNEIKGSVRDLSVKVTLSDVVSNVAENSSVVYRRDEVPPYLSLDPANFREVNTEGKCSNAYDPLGETARHGEQFVNFVDVRSMVWDQTNSAVGQQEFFYAGADLTSARLWIREYDVSNSSPLVIDQDKDGTCDEIDVSGAFPVMLDAIAPTGVAYYSNGATVAGGSSALYSVVESIPSLNGCQYKVDVPLDPPPPALCPQKTSDMYKVAEHSATNKDPVIYSIAVERNSLCTGTSLELRSKGLTDHDGWVCLASRAVDKVGNVGVSAPIAICYDNDEVAGQPSCWGNPGSAPDCSDGCTVSNPWPQGRTYIKR